ncbi:MAG: flavodoxin family protein [Candidatus Peribacter sp.]|jgi:flavodoxin I|nr:flavodoxin family protein [Candidatus Peribacter sp.]MBT4393279.1 flavodoxin family protein [Candidatus Peribacter sp.]MBT4601174.1 flavodoxin family protein [Candidatus Peribacter sp.]MBT5148866.1 flavodoxin family protein [Candidatus Peribacter sp.]MBT5637254.1 flavodoxin family protein [Candidatus Peribacter sp.]
MPSLHIIYASTSGNTEHVVDTLKEHLSSAQADLTVTVQRAEEAKADDIEKGDVLLLASSTWNYDAVEGYLNMHMREFLEKRAKDADLAGKPVGLIILGDDRYYYTGRGTERFMQYLMSHNGKSCTMPLIIINDPYGQEEKIREWSEKLMTCFNSQS